MINLFLKQCAGLAMILLFACAPEHSENRQAYVSILPMRYFVEQIAGGRVDVHVLVGPGQSPETYEPLPRQVIELSQADLFFRIGVPVEQVLIDRIRENNPDLSIIDLREGIELQPMETFEELVSPEDIPAPVDVTDTLVSEAPESHHHDGLDPHIWTSPRLVKIQAETIYRALAEMDPANREEYRRNLEAFTGELDRLSADIAARFDGVEQRKFMVFHPAWGYFAREFGLLQLPVEIEGKEPSPRELASIIDISRREGIRTIFVQPQLTGPSAPAIAESIGGTVVVIDPLAADYPTNLRAVAELLRTAMTGDRP